MNTPPLNPAIIPRAAYRLPPVTKRRLTKDPSADDKVNIAKPGVRTMKVKPGPGLPPAPTVHRHHRRNAPRPKRAK
jgi:hypothetical protein